MEIKIGEVFLTATDHPRGYGEKHETDIIITFPNFIIAPGEEVRVSQTVLASELKAAIQALEASCWRAYC